jgi:DHA1 family tetracycline resistance protein-like MFS transporter
MPASRTALGLIFLTVVIDLLGFGIVLPLLARYAEFFGLSGQALGLLLASFSAMQFLFAPLWGRLSDRIGRRPVLLVGLAGSTFFYSLFGYATSLGTDGTLLGLSAVPWLFIGRIGAGIAGATISTSQAYIADVTSQKDRGKGMALIGAAFGIGFTFGPLLGTTLVANTPENPAVLATAPYAQTFALTPTQVEQFKSRIATYERDRLRDDLAYADRRALKRQRDKDLLAQLDDTQRAAYRQASAPTAAPGYLAGILSGVAFLLALAKLPESLQPSAPGVAAERTGAFSFATLSAALARPGIAHLLATMFLTTFAFSEFESMLTLLTDALGMSDRENYFVFAYIGFILCLAQGFLVRRLLPKVGEYRMGVSGTVLMTIGLAGIALSANADSRGGLYTVLPIVVVGFACLTPSLQSLLSRKSSETEQGGILGLGQSASALARILGPWIGALLYDVNVLAPFWVATGLMVVGVLLVAALRVDPLPSTATAATAPTTDA